MEKDFEKLVNIFWRSFKPRRTDRLKSRQIVEYFEVYILEKEFPDLKFTYDIKNENWILL